MSDAGFDDVRDLYQVVILQRSRAPVHQVSLEPFDGAAKGDNPMCGDRIEVRVRMDGGQVAATGYQARGCAIVVASADLMVDAVQNRTPADIADLAAQFRTLVGTGACPDCGSAIEPLKPLAGVHDYPSRLRCATLPWDALQDAIKEATHG